MRIDSGSALIFRITHIDNTHWDIEHGLRCRNSREVNPDFRNIGNLDLIEKRKNRSVPVPPGGVLSDYVPFYFTPKSPMLYNIKTGYNGIPQVPMEDIVIYVAHLSHLAAEGKEFVITDRHAKLETAQFANDLTGLDRIDWKILRNCDFKRDPSDPGKVERYQAEALVHDHIPCASLAAIVCYSQSRMSLVAGIAAQHGIVTPVLVRSEMYFS